MEKSINTTIEGLQADIEELEKFIAASVRMNIKRQLEEQRNILKSRLEEEKRKLELSKANLEKEASANQAHIHNKLNKNEIYESINKYSFLSEDKFVK